MGQVRREQQEWIVAQCLNFGSEEASEKHRHIIATNPDAATAEARIRSALGPLATWPSDLCPEELSTRTIERLCAVARRPSNVAAPVTVPIRIPLHQRYGHIAAMVAVAAVALLALGIVPPMTRYMHYRHGCAVCRAQTNRLLQSLKMYADDHADALPVVDWSPGASWHRVGENGPENHSNTRSLYLLISLQYVASPLDFICCGAERDDAPRFDPRQHPEYLDFPSRQHVTYSYPVFGAGSIKLTAWDDRPLLADLNPHFGSLREGQSVSIGIGVKGAKRLRNSRNHEGRGQNVGWRGGHVTYERQPRWGRHQDDFYTQRDVKVYRGDERPVDLNDVFLF
jgi:hypothetical protein